MREANAVAAAAAARRLVARADVLVEADAELRRPLEDVEELAERQPEQREDHRDRVQDREEVVGVALHPGVAGREHQPGDADREEQDQRQEVFAEAAARAAAPWSRMRRRIASITPAITRNDAQTRPWKMRKPTSESIGNANVGKPKTNDPVAVEVARHRLEVDPAEHEREGDRDREDAAPHDQQVGEPAQPAARQMKRLSAKSPTTRWTQLAEVARAGAAAGRRPASRAASTAPSAGAAATSRSGR